MELFPLFSLSQYSLTSLLWMTVVTLFSVWVVKDWKARRMMKNMPGLPVLGDLPLIGSAAFVKKNPAENFAQLVQLCDEYRQKEIFAFRVGRHFTMRIFTANQAEKLLRRQDFLDKSKKYDFLHSWLGLSLLTSTGERWKRKRKLLTPSFHFNILKDALNTMNHHAFSFRDKLLQDISEKYQDKPFDIFHIFTLLSLDIIGETAMGIQIDALQDEESEYVKAIFLAKDTIGRRMRTPWLHPKILFDLSSVGRAQNKAIKFLQDYAYKVMRERRASMEGSMETRKNQAFLDTLLNCRDADGNPLTDEEIREEVDTFMFEGHDTVSSALSFTTHVLGKNPEIQEKCYQELLETFGAPKHFTMEDLNKMPYLEWCIKESIRLYPPVPQVARNISGDIELAGYHIPKDYGAMTVQLSGLHRDPAVFPEPEKFDPTRFSPDKSVNRHPYAYVPFSAGPRNCIGQRFAMLELKSVLATFLLTFKVESMQKHDSELRLNPGIGLEPENGIVVKLTVR